MELALMYNKCSSQNEQVKCQLMCGRIFIPEKTLHYSKCEGNYVSDPIVIVHQNVTTNEYQNFLIRRREDQLSVCLSP